VTPSQGNPRTAYTHSPRFGYLPASQSRGDPGGRAAEFAAIGKLVTVLGPAEPGGSLFGSDRCRNVERRCGRPFSSVPGQPCRSDVVADTIRASGDKLKRVMTMTPEELDAKKKRIQDYVEMAYAAAKLRLGRELDQARNDLERRLDEAKRSQNPDEAVYELEDKYIAEFLRNKASFYIDSHRKQGIPIGSEVMEDIRRTYKQMTDTLTLNMRPLRTPFQAARLTAVEAATGKKTFEAEVGFVRVSLSNHAQQALDEIDAKVQLYNMSPQDPSSSGNNVIHLSGPNSRVNISSVDRSTNIVNEAELFQSVEETVRRGVTDSAQKQAILQALDEMKTDRNKSSYLVRYASFISLVADHITIIAPFLPALAERASSLL
jgi:hypothetical protein